jgi:predicted DNA-binding transcriptional regulator AlpA
LTSLCACAAKYAIRTFDYRALNVFPDCRIPAKKAVPLAAKGDGMLINQPINAKCTFRILSQAEAGLYQIQVWRCIVNNPLDAGTAAGTYTAESVDRILWMRDLQELLGVHRSTIYRWIDIGAFPKRDAPASCPRGWLQSTVIRWQRGK